MLEWEIWFPKIPQPSCCTLTCSTGVVKTQRSSLLLNLNSVCSFLSSLLTFLSTALNTRTTHEWAISCLTSANSPPSRLLHASHVGPEDRPGGAWRAGEGESAGRLAGHGGTQRHVDTGGVALVHLPLYWRPPCRGKSTEITSNASKAEDGIRMSRWCEKSSRYLHPV